MEKLYGLIGEKLGHTYSPVIHQKIMQELNIDGHYGLFQVKRDNLPHVVSGLKALGYDGANVTIPYKTDIIKFLDCLSPEAKKIGAVNVVAIDREGMAAGYNTDYHGFGMMLKNANIKIQGENVAILGTGGASKAVSQYLRDNGIKNITFITRDFAAAKHKFPQDEVITYEQLNKLRGCSTIINATPVGMYPGIQAMPIEKKYLMNFSQAVDLIYNPSETLFIKQAKERGLKYTNGLYMLIAQAVKSQEIWNETEIPEDVTENILSFLKQEVL